MDHLHNKKSGMVTNMFDAFADETATHTQVTKFVSPWGLVVSISLWPVISSRRTTPKE